MVKWFYFKLGYGFHVSDLMADILDICFMCRLTVIELISVDSDIY